jgi:signal transduction histidine kinase/ActR/RegA family two-component response regulator
MSHSAEMVAPAANAVAGETPAPARKVREAKVAMPVLIVAPLGNDARLTADFLIGSGLPAVVCANVRDLCVRASAVGCGAMLLAEEVIDAEGARALTEWLARQPSWSDVPVAIVTAGGEAALPRRKLLAAFGRSGNVTLLERPFRPGTLVSTMEVALRSRERQFLVRDLLEQNMRSSVELEEQAAALREAARRKDEFLAMLAHELRNPLAAIGNAVGLLKETDENRAWAVDVIDRQGLQLGRLVDDLLDVSRITLGKIDLRRELLDAAACLESACEAVAPMAAERSHRLEAIIPRGILWIEADPTRLEQIAVNLLGNAIKYTERGGRIWIEARKAGNEIVIEVRDSGTGMAAGKIPEMFELFAQGERAAARSEGGLGIGLTVVRGLCQLHGGRVSAHSNGPGTGSTFTVRLPAAKAPADRPAPKAKRPAVEGGGKRVLIVDDNLDTARGLAKLLARRNYEVRLAHDGPGALKAAREFSPAVVLLDIGLPGMDGYEVARRLKAEPSCAEIAVIALSGYGQEADRRRSGEAGFDHHLVKPVDLENVLSLLTSERRR